MRVIGVDQETLPVRGHVILKPVSSNVRPAKSALNLIELRADERNRLLPAATPSPGRMLMAPLQELARIITKAVQDRNANDCTGENEVSSCSDGVR